MFEITKAPELSLLIEFEFNYKGDDLALQAKVHEAEEGDMVTMLVFDAKTRESVKVEFDLESKVLSEVSGILNEYYDAEAVLEKRIQH